MIVAIDLDWTLADLRSYYSKKFMEKTGIFLSRRNPPAVFKYLIGGSLKDEEIMEIVNRAWKDGDNEAELMDGEWPGVLRKMTDRGIRVILLTARSREDVPEVRKWLAEKGIIHYFADLCFIGEPEAKKEVKYDVLIDDELPNCLDALKKRRRAIWYEGTIEAETGLPIYLARKALDVLAIIGKLGGWGK